MPIIDEEGRVFGVINVVDALVVLLVFAVAAAGIALVVDGSGSNGSAGSTETRYVTVDFGPQPNYIIERLDEGDTAGSEGQSGTLTIADTYLTPTEEGTRVAARVAITGRTTEEGFSYGGRSLRLGQSLSFQADTYVANGTIRDIGNSSDLETHERQVLVTGTVPNGVAEDMSEGDEYRLGDRTLATMENLSVYGTGDPDQKRVYAGLSLQVLATDDQPRFGSQPLRNGATIPFNTTEYEFAGEITRLDATSQRGSPAVRTVVLSVSNVSQEQANSVREGLTETVKGRTVAEVTNVSVEPSTVVLTSESGEIYEREHPVNKDVTMTVDLRVREDGSEVRFKGQTLQYGSTVTLDLGITTVQASVVRLDE